MSKGMIPEPALGLPEIPGVAAEEKPQRMPKPADKHGWWWATGRRKTAVARVRLKPNADGQGKIIICKSGKIEKSPEEYFAEERDRADVYAALKACNVLGRFDIRCRLSGGGYMGQAQAIRLGISRALRDYDPALEPPLRQARFLTRDSREVERKKYGQAGARRRFQFSKR